MKISDDFIIKDVAGSNIVVPVEEKSLSFNSMLTLNNTGSFLWNCLKTETTKEEVIKKLIDKYGIDEQTAKTDVDEFIDKLAELGILE